ncbi:hypothetical protein [Thauera sinica]|uniref:Uncharacterized protein n=1 Tax=Thauera sinica TaxID=2665146 RepID=A0ABW1AV83_9RHOO|nr:hypothetical protein [Thauera sp. K11]
MKRLRISLRLDDGESAELTAALSCDGFEGIGRCYLGVKDFEHRIEGFLDYPLSKFAVPCIEGGYFKEDMSALSQTHLKIAAFPIGNVGKVALEVELSTPFDEGLSVFRAKLVTFITLEYEDLRRLHEALKSCIREPGVDFIVYF